ncbi:efflux RND transporter periplasmic adaptor subunit [Bradyrhizobium liaoningense]|uniref:efflux RND transporter periplasmic adaptor subunit n=1 Tax=Bradyrhizobium liaoningense TaxID=43992 RepID=UPI001BAB0BF1|nr:efflux RND transporter periplasmic adaptor subunit [Bradyrhizobium liaoningense]MBR0706992.1 efflux RND transporter periplasmic adaptor subunit [Bradyrhizobium liaoningense]
MKSGSRIGVRAANLFLLSMALAGCKDQGAVTVKLPTLVRTEIARLEDRQISVTLTGDVQARVQTDLAFRVSGRVTERLVDVGSHINAGDVLARIDPAEQQADVDAATAAVVAAESQVKVTAATFERQKALIASGFTTRASYDQAQEAARTAEASLETAQALLGKAKDALGYTELRSAVPGVVTVRNLEVGQVAQAGQSAFTLAQDGDRDAVFDVYETTLLREPEGGKVSLVLLSDSKVVAQGSLREVSPTIDPKTGTVRIKIAIDEPPAAMMLGSAVAGTARWRSGRRIVLPWGALTRMAATSAVWVVNPATSTVFLKPVMVDQYETRMVVLKGGLDPGERIVTEGGKLLSPGQAVRFAQGAS